VPRQRKVRKTMSKTMTAARDEYRRSMYKGRPRDGTEVSSNDEEEYFYPATMTTSSLIPIARLA
jgi:hypothetical protein